MHSESHPIISPQGLHYGTLHGMNVHGWPQAGLRLEGLDPTSEAHADALLAGAPNDPNHPVTFTADTGDPQLDRDLVTLGRHTMWNGSNLWPGQQVPQSHWNMAANYLRVHEGVPQEGPQQVDEAQVLGGHRPWYIDQLHSNQSPPGTVRSEMDSRVSKWSVVALGELQQPSAVGADQGYNPVTDGPNPDGPNFTDNAGNSPEQEQAVQTWVNMAVDLLNRGEPADAVIAQLAHDGCPDPQGVLQRAQQQPQQDPVSDDIGQDPFDAPPAPDPNANSEMQSTSVQPPVVTAHVRIKGTQMTGHVEDVWEDTWGRGIVRVALEAGGSMNVSPEGLEPVEAEVKSPVTEVQEFIDSLPAVEPHRPAIVARIENLEQARIFAVRAIKTASISDQVELDRIAGALEEEAFQLREWLRSDESHTGSVITQAYRHNALGLADSTPDREYEGSIREAAAIWAHESPYTAATVDLSVESAAMHARSLNMTGEQVNLFVATAKERIAAKKNQATPKVAATVENEGPAEALFI